MHYFPTVKRQSENKPIYLYTYIPIYHYTSIPFSHTNNHSHFICEKCGIKKHIDIKNIDFIKKNIPGSICHFQVDVTGVCDKCILKK